MTTRIHLDLTVDYELNGEDAAYLQQNLVQMVRMAIGNGLLTGATDAEVDEYSVNTTVDHDQQRDEIRKFLQTCIESDTIHLDTLAGKLADYGLMPVGKFVAEMQKCGGIPTKF